MMEPNHALTWHTKQQAVDVAFTSAVQKALSDIVT